ncbi:DUF3108 domain-containing protein [Massilia sp. KIM]|uniref:DUF3108 domain-containing protein n=1 Tax=Massilia sp. KIM TaxID=1955422 RepID=UPI0015C2C8BA|nr:DUF3108 domain-containing protein [Massilia sp. KIM]
MRIPASAARHGRLALLCLASLLAHLLVLAWLDARLAPPPLPAGALAVRLVAPSAPPPLPEAAPAPVPEPLPVAAPAPAPVSAPADTEAASASAAPEPAAGAGGAEPPLQMPGRYRVTAPPSITLDYRVDSAAPGRAPVAVGRARLEWESDGNAYRLRLTGVLGERSSEGGADDAGLAPLRAAIAQGAGTASIVFDRERNLVSDARGAALPLAMGMQDGASVLAQLAGMGLADPDQMQDVLEIVVSEGQGAHIARFQVAERETVDTGAGPVEALRLVRLAAAGMPRLELWLAPQLHWMPVRLRLSAPDGTVRTQTLAAAP